MLSVLIPLCVWISCSEPVEPFSPEPVIAYHSLSDAISEGDPVPSLVVQADRGMGDGADDVEQWRPLVAGHFEPEDVETVLCLMRFESGGNPDAQNRSSGASGLMQVMPDWAPVFGVSRSDLFTPEINLYIARRLRDDGGWNHWSPYKRGECR